MKYHNPTCAASTAEAPDTESDDEEYLPLTQGSGASSGRLSQEIRQIAKVESMRSQIKDLARIAGLDLSNFRLAKEFRKLSPNTQRQRVYLGRNLFSVISSVLAPDVPEDFQKLVCDRQNGDPLSVQQQSKMDGMMQRVTESFQNAPTALARQQALSLVAPFFQLSEIQFYLPGLSAYYYKRARLFAKMYKPGESIRKAETKKEKVSRKQIETVVQFITSPAVVVDLPFGTAVIKTTAGQKDEIPRVLRTQVNERIAQQYLQFMKETGQEKLAVSRSTILRILEYCPATTRKSMQGLDFFTWAGSEAFDMLIRITKSIANGDRDWEIDIIQRLKEAKQYLKLDYKLHLKGASRIADHCMTFALSDPKDSDFKKACAHDHDLRCERCESLKIVLKDIREQLESASFDQDLQKEEHLFDYNNAVSDIMELKKHIVRTVRQEQARKEILQNLGPTDVHIQMDWAMKFLPMAGREPQAEWFGKR